MDVSGVGSKGEDGRKVEEHKDKEVAKENGVSVVWSGPMLGGRGVEAVVDVSEECNERVERVSLRGVCAPLEGVFVREWGRLGLQDPCCVAASGGEVFVVNNGSQRGAVQVFSREGVFLRQWGTNGKIGKGEGEFGFAHGVAVSEGLVYVADQGNHRVQVFGVDGVFHMQWDTSGGEERPFSNPSGVTVSEGEVFVVDSKSRV